MCYLLNIWGFGGWYDTFWPPKSIGLHGTSSLRNWRIKNFYQDLCIFLHVKNDVSSWKVKKCSRNDKITSGTDLESWDTILLVKATLVNTCWQVLTSWCYQNVWKSLFWEKLTFFKYILLTKKVSKCWLNFWNSKVWYFKFSNPCRPSSYHI